jgi:cytochrome b involved in lipid metabolism
MQNTIILNMIKLSMFPIVITAVVLAAGVGFFSLTQHNESSEAGGSSSANSSPVVTDASADQLAPFTMVEVAGHDNIDDCYLVIENKVYDVTGFIDQHPGGVDKIVSGCGKEMTGIFAKIHSNKAWDLLKKFQVGVLSVSD